VIVDINNQVVKPTIPAIQDIASNDPTPAAIPTPPLPFHQIG
jgi:hypothetical protein